jgi:hypothetical protein
MPLTSNEAQVLLAVEAYNRRDGLSIKAAAHIYNVCDKTLARRLRGIHARRDTTPNSKKLTLTEEKVILNFILDLDARAFPPRLGGVEDMANILLHERNAGYVGKRWALNFVKRQPQLKTRYTRRYDYQRAQCEDPQLIRNWFRLVGDIRAKYGIGDNDMFNFDETGFMMGMISSSMVVTSAERHSKARMAQPGNREWVTVVQGASGGGWAIPPFIIVAGRFALGNWFEERDLPSDWVITTTHNGWTDNVQGLHWIKHFNKHTRSRKVGVHRLLVLDGHESHHSTEFEQYCQENNIITLCMPAHSSHILQPLDVGCFSPLKRAYGQQVENLIRCNITHITKTEFLSGFKAAHVTAMTENNIRGGFCGAGLVPHDPERVLASLDLVLRTPPPPQQLETSLVWISQTPSNATEAVSQSQFIRNRIAGHQHSSPTPIFTAVDQLARGTEALAHNVVLLGAQVQALQQANTLLSKRRKAKRTRLQDGGPLTVNEAYDILDQRDISEQLQQDMVSNSEPGQRATATDRRCGKCRNTGHNVRTCPMDAVESEESSSEWGT